MSAEASAMRWPPWARALVSVGALPVAVAASTVPFATMQPTSPGSDPSDVPIGLLGIQTLLGASILVEIGSFARSGWRAARVAGPTAHGARVRTMVLVAFAIAALQAWQLAKAYASMGASLAPPIVFLTILAGFAAQVAAAHAIGRWGLVNGALALLGAQALVDVVRAAIEPPRLGDDLGWRSPALAVTAAALGAAAVVVIARRARRGPSSPARTPYRDAELPTPTAVEAPAAPAGVVPLLLAIQLGGVLVLFVPVIGDEPLPRLVTHALLSGLLAVVLGSRLVAPARLSALWGRATGHVLLPDAVDVVASASRDAVVRGAAFAVALGFLAALAPTGVWNVAIGAAVVVDGVRAYRARRGDDAWAPAWPEPRAAAVAPAIAALRREGIPAHATDELAASLHPWIGPVAPITIMVPVSCLGRAREILDRVLPDDAAPPAPVRPGDQLATLRPHPAARAMLVGATLGLAAVTASAVASIALATHRPELPAGRSASLAIRRVDDAAAATLRDVALPAGGALFEESVSGSVVPYVRIIPVQGESLSATKERAGAWARSVAPEGTEVLLGPFEEDLDDGQGLRQVGFRTWLVRGEPIVREGDVVDARARADEDLGRASVSIELSATSAETFATATRGWTRRRMAFIVDGTVVSAPVVQGEIRGGYLQISMGGGDLEVQMRAARALAGSLAGR